MKLPQDFERTLTTMSDDELCDMLASYEEYLPEAIERARAELHRRKLSVAEVVHHRRNIQAAHSKVPVRSNYFLHWIAFHICAIALLLVIKSCDWSGSSH